MNDNEITTKIQRLWGNRHDFEGVTEDQPNRLITLDGRVFHDIPGFYLAIGEAINGRGGYFGACLDSLEDCFCGGFGVKPPVRITIFHCDDARRDLSHEAERQWFEANELLSPINPDDFEQEPESKTSQIPQAAPDETYFDMILEVLRRNANLELQ